MFQIKQKETARNTNNAKCSINKGFSRKFVFHIFSTMLHVFQQIVAIYSSKKTESCSNYYYGNTLSKIINESSSKNKSV